MFSFITSRRKTPSGRVFSACDLSGFFNFDRVLAEIRQAQGLLQEAAIGVRIGAHAPVAGGRQLVEARRQTCRASSNSSSGFL